MNKNNTSNNNICKRNITEFFANCENDNCSRLEEDTQFLCRKCNKFVCFDCTYKKLDRCLICSHNYHKSYGLKKCDRCKYIIDIIMCWYCGKSSRYCCIICNLSEIVEDFGDYELCCRNCQK